MYQKNKNTDRDINYKKELNRNSRAGNYNWNENLTREIQ